MTRIVEEDNTIYASVIELTEKELMEVLSKVYTGKGLYIYISKIILDWLGEAGEPYMTYEIVYGRENEFEERISVSPSGNQDFFLGQIYELISRGV